MKKLCLILGSAVLALTARGNTIVFNTFGPGDTYNQSVAYSVGSSSGLTYETAAQFTAAASGNLATVALGLTYFNPAFLGTADVYLYGDASGSPDNASQILLGSVVPTAQFASTNNSVVSFTVSGTVPVTMGSTYWLVLKPATIFELDLWNFSSVLGTVNQSTDDSTWVLPNNVLPAFRLTTSGSSVPDSGSSVLLMLGSVAALFVFGIPRKRAAN